MTPSIASVLESIRQAIASNLDAGVFLGAPDDAVAGLYLFPFHFREEPVMRQTPLDRTQGSAFHEYRIQCLLMTSPPDDYETLGRGLAYLQGHPLVDLDGEKGQISLSEHSVEALSRVFSASGTLYRLAVGFDVRFTAKGDAGDAD